MKYSENGLSISLALPKLATSFKFYRTISLYVVGASHTACSNKR